MNREEWLQERRKLITATDVAAILGLSPWRSPFDVWLSKTGQDGPQVDNFSMKMGRMLQPVVLDLYDESRNTKVKRFGDFELIKSPTVPWAGATPDAETETALVEAKTAHERTLAQWGEAGTDQVPYHYLCQVHWQMFVMGRSFAHIPVLFGTREFRIYSVERSERLVKTIVERCEQFWFAHVVAGKAPQVDGSAGASAWLKRSYPRVERRQLAPAPQELDNVAPLLAQAKIERDRLDQRIAAVENRMKEAIQDNEGIQGENWKAKWSTVRRAPGIDWHQVAVDMGKTAPKKYIKAIKRAETPAQETRRFSFQWKGDSNE